MKLKQIVDTTNDDVSDSDDEEIIIIPKRKPRVKTVEKPKPVKEQPIEVKETQPIKRENNPPPKPSIRFF